MSKREKILLVDDDVDLVETLRLVLENSGYTVLAAHNAEAGLTKADAERPDLILLDVMMPDSTEGFGLARRLRQRDESYFRDVPIVMLTAIQEKTGLRFSVERSGDAATRPEYSPVQGFLEKPIDPTHLLAKVQEVLTTAWREG